MNQSVKYIAMVLAVVAIITSIILLSNGKTETPMSENPIVTIESTQGQIQIELFTDKTPITAGNFAKLAGDGFYDGTRIHRVMPGFMIQGGDPKSKDAELKSQWGTGGPGYAFDDEFDPALSNRRGFISMANAGPNTNGSQFFILVADSEFLDGKHAVFGEVIKGMDVVDAIVNIEHGNEFAGAGGGIPTEDVIFETVTVSGGETEETIEA
ncbi:MAG: peptidylprolyl isomerase [Candidatus Nomurabacteria bacterium]|nr:peptidylprolyl isomerase [Candidatus Nomurabacteria bacterium]